MSADYVRGFEEGRSSVATQFLNHANEIGTYLAERVASMPPEEERTYADGLTVGMFTAVSEELVKRGFAIL